MKIHEKRLEIDDRRPKDGLEEEAGWCLEDGKLPTWATRGFSPMHMLGRSKGILTREGALRKKKLGLVLKLEGGSDVVR